MVLLRVQPVLRDEQREVHVLHPQALDPRTKPVLDRLPDGKGPRAEDVAPGDVVVGDHLGGQEGFGVPVGEVGFLGRGEAELGFFLFVGRGAA